MSKHQIRLINKKERVVLSDILPYETPVIFSNKYFYDFLIKHDLHYTSGKFQWKSNTSVYTDKIILILLGQPIEKAIKNIDNYKFIDNIQGGMLSAIPFKFQIAHNSNIFRELSIIHPKNQIIAVDFYEKFKELIIYYCSLSKFSLRNPTSIAKYSYLNDKSRINKFNKNHTIVEEINNEYKNLKSFFVYPLSNVFKFYESKDYHICEQKYKYMSKLDISKCFDSIYTHSIAWAIIGEDCVKDALSNSKTTSLGNTFAGQFDSLMQSFNYQETNGILIGPEISRIFSEIILQKIDVIVLEKLFSKEIIHRKDFEIFRYVDDYFLFYNSEDIYNKISNIIQQELKKYKLQLNTLKEVKYSKPIITEITIAKSKISELLNHSLSYTIGEIKITKENNDYYYKNGHIFIKSSKLISNFKTIIKETNISYKDILNYSLTILESKTKEILKKFLIVSKNFNPELDKNKINLNITHAILEILDFLFFIYSAYPRVNTTIKLCRIIEQIILFLEKYRISIDLTQIVKQRIFDHVLTSLKNTDFNEYNQIETLYLLITLSRLGREYWLEELFLAHLFGAEFNQGEQKYILNHDLNYFSITLALFYIKNKKRYHLFKNALIDKIIYKFKAKTNIKEKDSELTLLFLDLLVCPYISKENKHSILELYNIDIDDVISLEQVSDRWFTKWDNLNFARELDYKRSLNVY